MNRIISTILFFSILSFGFLQLHAQELIQPQRVAAGAIVFDGRPFEAAWGNHGEFPMTVNMPTFGAAPSENSETMIVYDNEYLWVGARLFVKDASSIIAKSKKRDEVSANSDMFGITLDTYNNNQNAYAFITMPTGLRLDLSVSDDAWKGLRSCNYDWNTFWDVKTSRDERGWYVEMRIPFTSLRFNPEDGIATMGIIIFRYIRSLNEWNTFPALDPKLSQTAYLKPSLASDIQFKVGKNKRPVYVSPYAIGGISKNRVLNSENTEYVKNDHNTFDVGLDVKYSVNSNLTLDLTLNPDFAQVEADDQQVNLTRFSLSFPEKRQFFQEGANMFNFSLLGPSNLFYSRNIGLYNGAPVKIIGGSRLYGSLGKWEMGVMDIQTEKSDKIPGENFGVVSAKRQVLNPYSYVSSIFTSRISSDGRRNFAYGVDGLFKLSPKEYFINFKIAQTFDNRLAESIRGKQNIDPLFIYSRIEKRGQGGFNFMTSGRYTGKHFCPGAGFVQKSVGIYGVFATVSYGWLAPESSKLFKHGPKIMHDIEKRLSDNSIDIQSITANWEIETKKGFTASVGFSHRREGVVNEFALSGKVPVAPGVYSFTGITGEVGLSSGSPFTWESKFYGGNFFDGQNYNVSFMPVWNISSSLKLSGAYAFNNLRFPNRQQSITFNIHQLSANVLYMFSDKLSASAFVQHVNTTNDLVSNFRIRYNPGEGRDLYIVLNDVRRTGGKGQQPPLPAFFNNTIMIKYTHTFAVRL